MARAHAALAPAHNRLGRAPGPSEGTPVQHDATTFTSFRLRRNRPFPEVTR